MYLFFYKDYTLEISPEYSINKVDSVDFCYRNFLLYGRSSGPVFKMTPRVGVPSIAIHSEPSDCLRKEFIY